VPRLDEVDLKIIDILSKNSRTSFRKIAKEMKISTDTVMRRYKKLEKEGKIQPTITVDCAKLGYEAMVGFNVRVEKQSSLPKVMTEVGKIPDIVTTIRLLGTFDDLLLIACVRSLTHVTKIGEKIEATPGIKKVIMDPFWVLIKENSTFPHTSTLNL
jgi:Lrp/AsnC family transcriptional regulator for asnA, asnC and gidA